jgi:RNA polymerase sigma-70 factor, ECF subfamily
MYREQLLAEVETLGIPAHTHPRECREHPFHLLLAQEIPGLQRHALKLTRNWHSAQDLVQETLTKAWASRDRFIADSNLRAWLNTILRNTFLSAIRKKREIEDTDGSLTAALTQPPPQDHAIALAELLKAMTFLPFPQRDALTLVGVAGFSVAEAAVKLGCANGTVKSRVSRARTSLAARLMPNHRHDGQRN